jgi:hypothetical protein
MTTCLPLNRRVFSGERVVEKFNNREPANKRRLSERG